MKLCTKCGELKSKSDFCKESRSKDGLAHRCKHCSHEYMKQYYERNKQVLIERGKEYRKNNPDKRRKRVQKATFMINAFKSPCKKCSEDRFPCIDFHHIDPATKKLNISTVKWFANLEDIKAEVEKCVCLCKNCHAEFHYLYGTRPDNPVESLNEYLKGDNDDEREMEL